ncbi:hypothetical protein ACFL6I_23250 [candidate division KSB1 bacterium]
MSLKKFTKSYSIKAFTNQINESLYHKYFTEKEISSFGNKRKKGSLAARHILKQLLIEHLNNEIKHTDIEILNNEMGKPTLKIYNHPTIETKHIYFSLSHSKDMIAVLLIFEDHES